MISCCCRRRPLISRLIWGHGPLNEFKKPPFNFGDLDCTSINTSAGETGTEELVRFGRLLRGFGSERVLGMTRGRIREAHGDYSGNLSRLSL
eukprot:scaffold33511_cov130-Skeletonema_dohrnii-CCMP3373.AAC.4